MADLTVTATQVLPSTGAKYMICIAGEAITHGQPIYKKTSDGLYYKADADASAETAQAVGIAMSEAVASGQPIVVQYDGDLTLGAGAAPAAATAYYVSPTAGGICPEADILSADYMTRVGYGIGTNAIRLDIKVTGVAHG